MITCPHNPDVMHPKGDCERCEQVRELREHLATCTPSQIRARVQALHRMKLTNVEALLVPSARAKLDRCISACNQYLNELEAHDGQ